ncbi:hypothetical protein ASE23_11775 [Rhizobium sp. Root73]|nr:hypothetical protein ASC96_13440 [Rhizobium sp. Root1204]KQY03492.1 hypothetical protein ASD36_13970 [Rhizobium sp. Root1334]KRC00142.1 hypothetical protein ASE23_11775 [Rhizobium sp. Root73]
MPVRLAHVQAAVSIGAHVSSNTGDYRLKARRIPLGLLYIATLILLIILIPLIQFSASQSSSLAHRLSSATTLRLDKMKL